MANDHNSAGSTVARSKSAAPNDWAYSLLASPTFILLAINVVVFCLFLWTSTPPLKASSEHVLKWGGNYAPLTLSGQWWRLFTSIFVHIGPLHLAVNLWCLYQLGNLAESLYGRWSFLLLYLLAGVAGSIASISRAVMAVSAGSSGAIFGVAGALITSLCFSKLPAPRRDLVILLGSLVVFAAYNLAYGFLKGGIDNGAHVGGLVCGLVIGIFLSRDFVYSTGSPRKHVFLFSATTLVLLFTFGLVRQMKGPIVLVESARQALNRGDADLAIRQLNALRREKREDPTVYSILGAAYGQKGQYAEAEVCFHRVLEMRPSDTAARSNLALLYLSLGRLENSRREFAKAVELNPKAEGDWVGLGLALQRMARHEEAITAFTKALNLNPNLIQAHFALGISAMNLRRYDDAIAAFKKVAEFSPKSYPAQIWLANAYQAAGLKQEADAAYTRAAQLQKSSPRNQ